MREDYHEDKSFIKGDFERCIFLLCVSAVSADALLPDSENEIPENSTQIDVSADETCFDEYEKYTEKVILSMKDEGYSSSTDYEITSIYPLYEIYSYDEPYSLMYDIKCSDGTYYSMLVNCERNVVSVSRKRQSLHSRYVEENGINPDNIRFIHELFGAYYLDVETGIFYDCETGEVAVPLTQEEMEEQKAEREMDMARSSEESIVMTEKQKQKLKEKAEYERQKAEKQKLNTAAEMSSYPKLANSIRKNKYILLYPIYDVTAPLKKDLPKITLTIASAILYKPEN